MSEYREYKPGDPVELSADEWNRRYAEIERRGNVSVSGPLTLSQMRYGRVLSMTRDSEHWAKLGGSSSPYSFQEVRFDGSSWAVVSGGYTGTSNAYEVNRTGGLSGKIVWMVPGYPGDWRFQWIGSGHSSCPCYFRLAGPCAMGYYRIRIINSSGVTIITRIVYFGIGYAGHIIDRFGIAFPGPGNYTVDVSSVDGTIAFPATDATPDNGYVVNQQFPITVDCAVHEFLLNIVVPYYTFDIGGIIQGCFPRSSYGDYIENIRLSISGPGDATLVVDPHGHLGLSLSGSDIGSGEFHYLVKVNTPTTFPISWTVTASNDGYISDVATFTFQACDDSGTITGGTVTNTGATPVLFLTRAAYPAYVGSCTKWPFTTFDSASWPLPGATVTLSGGLVGTGTTDGTGHATVTISAKWDPTRPIVVTLSHPRYVTQDYTASGGPQILCGFSGTLDNPASGYVCACCPEAMPTTLHMTVGAYTGTLTATVPDFRGMNYNGSYTGQLTANVNSYPWTTVYADPPANTRQTVSISSTATGGNVCYNVTFTCGRISFDYTGTTIGGDTGTAQRQIPVQYPCVTPTFGNEYPASRLWPIPQTDSVSATPGCNPFLFTAPSPVPSLPGTITITE